MVAFVFIIPAWVIVIIILGNRSDKQKRKSKPNNEGYDTNWDYERGQLKSLYWRREEWINNHAIPNLYVLPSSEEHLKLLEEYRRLNIPLSPYPHIFVPKKHQPPSGTEIRS